MRWKRGITSDGLSETLLQALDLIDGAYRHYGEDPVITSAGERWTRHKVGSLHYLGRAVDIRTRGINEILRGMIHAKLRELLGPDFQVNYEPEIVCDGCVLRGEHFHVEFDPKPKWVPDAAA